MDRKQQLAALRPTGEVLVFLDADCVPSASLLATYAAVLDERELLAVGETRYLPKGFVPDGTEEAVLRRAARPHPERGSLFSAPGVARVDPRYELFWSLNFAVRRATSSTESGSSP